MKTANELLIDPAKNEVAAALLRAMQTANEGPEEGRLVYSCRCLALRCRGDHRRSGVDIVSRIGPAAWNKWAALVSLGWWTDHVGRRHHRVVGQLRPWDHDRVAASPLRGYPLWHVYPNSVVLRQREGLDDLFALCPCGVCGSPAALGWAGERCGPCQDRLEEGAKCPTGYPSVRPGVGTRTYPFSWTTHGWLIASEHNFFVVYDLASGKPTSIFNPETPWRGWLTFNRQGLAAIPVPGARVHVYDILGQRTREIHLPGDVDELRFAPQGRWLAATGSSSFLIDLEAANGAPRPWPPGRRLRKYAGVAWSADGRTLYGIESSGTLLGVRSVYGRSHRPFDREAGFSPSTRGSRDGGFFSELFA